MSETPSATVPSPAARLRGAIWGQLVGDAFCLGSHWIYDLAEMAATFPPDGPNGFEEPRPGHYHAGKHPGDPTHYGEGALLMLESVAANGRFDAVDFGQRFVSYFGAPDHRGYLDHATRDTLQHAAAWMAAHPGQPFDYQQGADDDQLATAARLVPVVIAARGQGEAALFAAAESATRVAQNNPLALACMKANALILHELLAGRGLTDAFQQAAVRIAEVDAERGREVSEDISTVSAWDGRSVTEAALEFGQSCPLAGSFPVSVQCASVHGDSFPAAMLANARAGGDNAGRGALIGGWLGARLGVAAIPAEWRRKLTAHDRVDRWTEQLVTASANHPA